MMLVSGGNASSRFIVSLEYVSDKGEPTIGTRT